MKKSRTNYSLATPLPTQAHTEATLLSDIELIDQTLCFTVPASLSGERLDKALAHLLSTYSRGRIQAWIDAGQATINGHIAKIRQPVFAGDQLQLTTTAMGEDIAFTPEKMSLSIVYEDAHIIVINKPAGLVVHPAAGNWQSTLLNGLLHAYPELSKLPRAGIVHRLDKDTSGLMVVARTLAAQTNLVNQLQARSVKRHYIALAWGSVPLHGCVDAPIGRDPRVRTRMAIMPSGKPARTHFHQLALVARERAQISLVHCQLDTGRTHQIRVHLASIKHPLLGDALYGRDRAALPDANFKRQALHAYSLGLIHPSNQTPLIWHALPPDDMAALIVALAFPPLETLLHNIP